MGQAVLLSRIFQQQEGGATSHASGSAERGESTRYVGGQWELGAKVIKGHPLAPPPSIEPLDGPVQSQANPQVHQQPEVNPVRLMATRRRQVWHQQKKVKQVARNHGNKLLEKSSQHAVVGHRQEWIRCWKSGNWRHSFHGDPPLLLRLLLVQLLQFLLHHHPLLLLSELGKQGLNLQPFSL